MVDSCHLSQMLFSLIDLLLQRSPDKPWLHSRLMASWSRNRRPGQKVGQRTKAIRRASSLQQRNEVQARPSTLLLEYSEQCSAHGSLLPMDEQLHWSFQLQVFPAISCIHSCVSQHGMFCYVEFRLRLSICAWHNSNYPWVRWPGWIACCGTDSLLRLSPVDAVQEFDHYRVLWKVGTGKLHLALWHGSLGQPTKCSGRKCHALVSASPLHTRRWNNISKSRFPAKMIRAKLELVSCRLRILHGPNLPKCQTHWQWTWRMSVWSVADRESTPMHDGGKRQTDPVQVSCSASEWYDNFVWTCVAKPKRSMGTSRIAQESSRVKVKGHDLFLEAWTHGQWLSRTFLSLPRFQNDANSWSLTRQWPLRDFSVNTPIASFAQKPKLIGFTTSCSSTVGMYCIISLQLLSLSLFKSLVNSRICILMSIKYLCFFAPGKMLQQQMSFHFQYWFPVESHSHSVRMKVLGLFGHQWNQQKMEAWRISLAAEAIHAGFSHLFLCLFAAFVSHRKSVASSLAICSSNQIQDDDLS